MSSFEFPWQRTAAGANLLSDQGDLGVTIFEEITALALKHDAINLGQGFPDTDGPQMFKDIAAAGVTGSLNQYAPGSGIFPLRHGWGDGSTSSDNSGTHGWGRRDRHTRTVLRLLWSRNRAFRWRA